MAFLVDGLRLAQVTYKRKLSIPKVNELEFNKEYSLEDEGTYIANYNYSPSCGQHSQRMSSAFSLEHGSWSLQHLGFCNLG